MLHEGAEPTGGFSTGDRAVIRVAAGAGDRTDVVEEEAKYDGADGGRSRNSFTRRNFILNEDTQ